MNKQGNGSPEERKQKMIRVYNSLGFSPSEYFMSDLQIGADALERARQTYDVVHTGDIEELESALFRVADTLDVAFIPRPKVTKEVFINSKTGNWSMTLRNPGAGLRVVITGESYDLPIITEKIKEWLE
jgi:hypothetical protein